MSHVVPCPTVPRMFFSFWDRGNAECLTVASAYSVTSAVNLLWPGVRASRHLCTRVACVPGMRSLFNFQRPLSTSQTAQTFCTSRTHSLHTSFPIQVAWFSRYDVVCLTFLICLTFQVVHLSLTPAAGIYPARIAGTRVKLHA